MPELFGFSFGKKKKVQEAPRLSSFVPPDSDDGATVLSGGGVWDPSIRGIYSVPAELHFIDLVKATCLSLGLSFLVTIIPARRAASLNPVDALRYE